MRIKRTLAAVAVAAGTLGTLFAVQSPAQASGCKAEVVSLGAPRTWHADCKTGSGTVRCAILIRSGNGASYYIYGPWVKSTKPSQSSVAYADPGLNVIAVYAQLQ